MTVRPRRRAASLALAALLGAALTPALQPTAAQAATVDASGGAMTIHDSLHLYDDLAPIALPDGPASRYPASVTVSGSIGGISRVEVDLVGFSHARPDDVDLLLVGPGGQAVTLMSGVGGSTAVNGIDLTFGDRGALGPDNGPLTSGVLAPTDFDGTDTYPAPAPATSPGTSLSVFDGTSANGTWSLYAVDDTSVSTGSVAEGWTLAVDTYPSTTPYPSTVQVQGQSTAVADVDVTLTGLHHGFARDLDVVLVGPDGTAVTLMSDAGGTGAVDANLTFSDEAGSDVPAGSGIPSSTYRSANYDDPSDYQPDPFTDAGARLSAFQGRTANGTWSLYVDDDSPDDEGTLDGWTLHITTQQPPPRPVPADTTAPTGTLTLLTTSGGAEVTSSRTVYLKVAASEPLAGIRVSNDGETFGSLIPAPTADYSTRWTLGDHDGSRRVLIQLQDLAGNVSQGYVSDTVTLDRIAPRVQRVWPAAGATEVRRGKAVRARFDSPVTPNVALKYLAHLYRVGSTKPVAAVVRFDALTATVAVVPSKSLRADTRYKAVIESGFKDAARNFNDQDSAKAGAQRMVWKFRTR